VHAAGDMGNGDYRCAECGYGIVVLRVLPTCPMCRGQQWIEREVAPFRHAVGQ
jgi:lipopolysaccharide biosynthesis regulator YciM